MNEKEDNQIAVTEVAEPEAVVRMLGKDLLEEKDNVRAAVSARIRELMKAETFSVLTGAGSSVSVLGQVTFGQNALDEGGWLREAVSESARFQELLKLFQAGHASRSPAVEYGVEEFIHFLYQLQYVDRHGLKVMGSEGAQVKVAGVLTSILAGLKEKCATGDIPSEKLGSHRAFLKRIISRPTNLKRTNLFTTNYDLIFEYAMDEMGLLYVDGFVGGARKFFKPQAFNYDYYYPASTTEGKVTRLERVLHFYKLHGSLNWVESKAPTSLNIYGIQKKEAEIETGESVLVYPTPMKEHETIGFPYSELLRRFAGIIQQPQSVLITYGYGFGDAHINRAIYEALNIPSFQLVIVSHGWTPGIKAIWQQHQSLPCVGFVVGPQYARWDAFAKELIPDLPTVELEERYEKRQAAARMLRDLAVSDQARNKEAGDGE